MSCLIQCLASCLQLNSGRITGETNLPDCKQVTKIAAHNSVSESGNIVQPTREMLIATSQTRIIRATVAWRKKLLDLKTSVKNSYGPFDDTYPTPFVRGKIVLPVEECNNPPTTCEKKKRKPKQAVIMVKVRHGKLKEQVVYTRVPQNVFCGEHNNVIQRALKQKLADKEQHEYDRTQDDVRRRERVRKDMTQWVNSPDVEDCPLEGLNIQGHFHSCASVRKQSNLDAAILNLRRAEDAPFGSIDYLSEDQRERYTRLVARNVCDNVDLIREHYGLSHAVIDHTLSFIEEFAEDGNPVEEVCGDEYSPQGMFEDWRAKARIHIMGAVGDPEKVAEVLFKLETLLDTVILMYNSSSWKLALLQLKTYICHITGQSLASMAFKEVWEMANEGDPVFTRPTLDTGGIFGCLPDEHWMYGELKPQGFVDFMDTFKRCFTCWQEVVNCDFVKKLRRMIAYCVALGLCSVTAIPFTFLKFEEFYTSSGLEAKAWPELWTGIIDTVLWMYDKGLALFRGEPIMSVLGTATSATEYETKYAKIVGNIALYESAHLEKIQMEAPEYELALNELIESTTLLHRRASGPEKRILACKLLELERIKVRVLTCVNSSHMRRSPFALFLSGTSGVGKTTSVDAIIHYLLRVNNMSVDPHLWTSLSADDAYQSELQHWHRVIKMDDVGNIKSEWEERTSLKTIIDYINNQPVTALKADVDSKGKVQINPDIVVATTNTLEFEAHVKSNEPLAVLRRFFVRLLMTVRPEFRLEGSTMIDPAKLARATTNDPHQIPDAWLFDVERAMPTGFTRWNNSSNFEWKAVEHEGQSLMQIRLPVLLRYLKFASRRHFAEQKEFLSNNAWLHTVELCPHEMYENLCEECNPPEDLNPQGAVTDCAFKKLQEFREWAYVVTDYTPEAVKENKLFSMLFEQISSLGMVEAGLSRLQFCSWLGAGFFAGISFLFACATPYVIAIGAIAWCTTYVYLSVMYIHQKMKTVKKYSMMVVQPLVTHKYAVGAAFVVALIVMLRNLRPKAKLIGSLVTQACNEDYVPPPDAKPRENVYVTPYVEPMKHKHEMKTMTHEHMIKVSSGALAFARFTYADGQRATCNMFPYKGNTWIAPYHMMRRGVSMIDMKRSPGDLNNNRVCKITDGCWRRVPGTDLALVSVVTMGEVINTSDYYYPTAIPPRNQAMSWVCKDEQIDVKMDEFNATLTVANVPDTKFEDVYSYSAWSYSMSFPTQEGFCMAPLVAKGKVPYIMGFHTAGINGNIRGVGCVVHLELLKSTYVELFSRNIGDYENINVQVASQGEMVLDYPEYNIKALGTLHEKSPFNYRQEPGHVEILGAHTGNNRTFKSKCVNTVMSAAVTEEFGVPPLHGPPKGMNTHWPWHNDLDAVLSAQQMNPKYLGMAYADLELKYTGFFSNLPEKEKERVRPLGHTATLSGVDGVFGIDAMKLATSMGWPYCKPKSHFMKPSEEQVEGITRPLEIDEKVMANITRIENGLREGHREYVPFRMNLKDEPVKLTKKSVRTFGGGPIELLYLLRKYFLPVVKVIMDNPQFFSCAVGINATSKEWTEMAKFLQSHGSHRSMNGDYGKFDSKTINQNILLAFTMLTTCAWISGGYTSGDLMVMTSLATEVAHPVVDYNGEYALFRGSHISGNGITVFVNNIVNMLDMGAAYYELADWGLHGKPLDHPLTVGLKIHLEQVGWTSNEINDLIADVKVPQEKVHIGSFSEHVAIMCYGDDNNMSVAEECTWFNHTLVSYTLSQYGIVYTMADKEARSVPFMDFKDTTFLKRAFVWNEKLQNYMAPLEITSLYKTLHSCIKSKVIDEFQQGAEAVLAVNRELFFHGPEVFEDMHAKLERVVDKSGLRIYLPYGKLPSYQFYETAYVIDNDVQLTLG
jgi:hypothetical protein